MNWNSPLDILINALSGGAFLGFLVFVIVYATFSNWRATPPGRALMYAVGSLDMIVLLNTIHLFTGPYPGQVFVRIPVYLLLLGSSWNLVRTLVQILHAGQPITVSSFVEPRNLKENPMPQHIAITEATVPDVWYKTQRLIRTIIASLVVLVPLANSLAAVVIGYLNSQTDLEIPAWAFVILNGVIAVTAFIMGLVSRIMAIPAVNVWLTKLGAGSIPASAIIPPANGKTAKVAPDPTL